MKYIFGICLVTACVIIVDFIENKIFNNWD